MTVETTTVTKQQAEVENISFDVTIYEMRTTAFCECCPNEASGTRTSLESQGWHLGQNEQFCPECNF